MIFAYIRARMGRAAPAVSVLAALALFSPGCTGSGRTAAASKGGPTSDHPVVIRWKDYNVLDQPDQERIVKIQNAIYRQHTITDSDLGFALNRLTSEPPVDRGDNKLSRQCMVLTMLIGRKDVTKPQAARFLKTVAPFASGDNSTVAGYAVLSLEGLRDDRIIPVMERIARQTKNPRIRTRVSSSLPRLKEKLRRWHQEK